MADLIPTAEEVQPTNTPTPSPSGQSRLPAVFRSLKHRNFRLFFGGQLISLVGTWMQTIAEAWLIYRLTGSSVLLGLLGFVGQIPIFLLSPIGGLAADRWPRQRVVITTQVASMLLGFTLAALTLTGRIRVWEIIMLATLLGVVNAFDVPARQSFLIEMVGREGFRFVRHARPIRTLLILLGVVSFMALPFSVLMPIFADRILHGGASAYGNLMGAVGLGAMFGALSLAMRQELRGLGKIVAYSAIGLGASLTLFGASRWFWASFVALTLAGFTMMMQFTSINTLIQAMVPDQLRGRVMSLYSMMFLGMAPLGSLVAGTLADRIGAPVTVALGGLASLAGGIVFARKWPSLRGPARELVAAQGMMRPQPPPAVTSPREP